MEGLGGFQDETSDFINKKCNCAPTAVNVKKKENILQNGEQSQLLKQGSGYLKPDETGGKLTRLKSKDRL